MIGLVVLFLLTGVVNFVRMPSKEEKAVAALFDMTRGADIWTGEPVIFEDSRPYVLSEFDAFDPDRWHGWDELSPVTAISAANLVTNANVYSGEGLLTLGKVNGYNQLGGGLVVQLQPVETGNQDDLTAKLSGTISDSDQVELLSNPVDSSADSHLIIYCLVTPRPFFQPNVSGYMIAKGVVIAAGRTFRGDGSTSQVAYLACSSVDSP